MKIERFTVEVSPGIGSVTAELVEPTSMDAILVLAHGAGAGMDHRFMKTLAKGLAEVRIGTVRYNFPYMEKGKGRPDPPAIAEKTVQRAIEHTSLLYPAVRLIAGGKSFGGRMTSGFVARNGAGSLKGIVFYGFPLHPAGKPSTERAVHLKDITVPLLFLQGTRDSLATLDLIRQVTQPLHAARLVLFEGADHSFSIGKREIIPELVTATRLWTDTL
jgi:uncharacterized protein